MNRERGVTDPSCRRRLTGLEAPPSSDEEEGMSRPNVPGELGQTEIVFRFVLVYRSGVLARLLPLVDKRRTTVVSLVPSKTRGATVDLRHGPTIGSTVRYLSSSL